MLIGPCASSNNGPAPGQRRPSAKYPNSERCFISDIKVSHSVRELPIITVSETAMRSLSFLSKLNGLE
jgi:hypothetical protein